MADKFERLKELGEYPFPVYHICNSIYRYLQRKGFDISDKYIEKILRENAPQYVNASYERSNSSTIDIKLQQDEILEALDTLKKANKKILKREQIQDIIPSLYETVDEYEEYAIDNNITPVPSGQATEPAYDAEELDPFRDAVITDKPDARESNIQNATLYLCDKGESFFKTLRATAKMMYNYPPDEKDDELEKEGAKSIIDWGDWFGALEVAMKGGTDRKYRRSIRQWVKITKDEEDWGKHAASSKNPYIARFKDKEGKWKEEVRKLTREQIGDKAMKVKDFENLFKKLVPACMAMVKWSELYLHPFTNGESVKLSSKLSDRSLR